MLGADCVLVDRTPAGYRTIERDNAGALQKCFLTERDDPDWLFQQCQRIAAALNKGEVALAQIYGLRIPISALDDCQVKRSAFAKVGFNPDEPRIPKGDPHGGEWTDGEWQSTDQLANAPMNRNKDDCIEYCFERSAAMRDRGGDPFWACLRACQGRFRNPLFPEFDSHFD